MNHRCEGTVGHYRRDKVGTAARGVGGCAIVKSDKVLKIILLTGIAFDTLDNALAADSAVIGYIVVHTTVILGAEHSARVHIATLEDIDDVAVTGVKYEMTPADFVHLARQFEVVIPSQRLAVIDCIDVSAAYATAEVNKSVVIDILVTELAETVATSLMLNDTA